MEEERGDPFNNFFYPFLFEGKEANLADILTQVRHSILEKCHETIALRKATFEYDSEQIMSAGRLMAEAFMHGATLLAFGNGGGATAAQDLVTNLLQPSRAEWQPLPAISLTNDNAVVTAIGNDVGFENVFARQISVYGRGGDIAIGLSTSGNSTNLLIAFEHAKKLGLHTIGLSGYDGGKMRHTQAVDVCITAPGDYIPRIQEAQATVYHTLIEIVQTLLRHNRATASI